MDHWQKDFLNRIREFQNTQDSNGIALSVKVRVVSGCFCPNCCPDANRIIRCYLDDHPFDRHAEYIEHESGPEILTYIALGVAGIGLAKECVSLLNSIVQCITTIVKARADGRKLGDKRDEPLVIIVRGVSKSDNFFEKQVLEIKSDEPPPKTLIEEKLTQAVTEIVGGHKASADPRPKAKKDPAPSPKKKGRKRKK